ncbi:MAG: preprotein translocase subunit SecE [Acidimicrobiia bacterium]|jgi:preprotein translocase SecE subunit
MNREMRRLQEREERRQKKQDEKHGGRRSPVQAGGRPPVPEREPLWQRLTEFLREVRVELRKVSWPTRQQMITFTAVTLITSFSLTLLIFGVDVVLKEAVLFVIGRS